jgi:hypothetical protein
VPEPQHLGGFLSLLAQILALLAAGAAIAFLIRRADRSLRPVEPVAVAVTVVLVAIFVSNLWEGSRRLDRLRADHRGLSRDEGREACLGAPLDPSYLRWLEARIPMGERYYLAMDRPLTNVTGDQCVSMLLLPRRRVEAPERARYLVLWGAEPPEVRGERTRPGNSVETFTPRHYLIRRG